MDEVTLSHFNGIPYVDRNAARCTAWHKIKEYPDLKREGWIRTGCHECGALVGYRPKNSSLTGRRRSAILGGMAEINTAGDEDELED